MNHNSANLDSKKFVGGGKKMSRGAPNGNFTPLAIGSCSSFLAQVISLGSRLWFLAQFQWIWKS